MITKIEWADVVWNPVTGCTKISPGCQNCYAERMSKRLAGRCGYPANNPFRVTLHPERLEEPLSWKKTRKIFVCSMSDLFHEDVPDKFILATFVAMGLTYKNTGEMEEISPGHRVAIHKPRHTFMILTKRPERMKNFVNRLVFNEPDKDWEEKAHFFATSLAAKNGSPLPNNAIFTFGQWVKDGMPGLWLGVTAENQEQADKRIPVLLQIPAAVRFVSVEPMLGMIDLKLRGYHKSLDGVEYHGSFRVGLSWVICGGESGPRARPIHPDWVRKLRDQCQAAGVPYFFKQWGEWIHTSIEESEPFIDVEKEHDDSDYFIRVGKKQAGRLLDGRTWDEFPGKVI